MKYKDIQQLKTKSLPELQKDLAEYREKLRKLQFDLAQGKVKNIRAELQKDLADYREKLRKLQFDLAQGKVKNIREIKETKKIIARILTIINQSRSTRRS